MISFLLKNIKTHPMTWKIYLDEIFFECEKMLHWWKENKAFKMILDQGREYPRRSSELRIGLPGVVFNQTIQCLVFISTNKNISRVLPENVCILFENWTLCHCADSLQSNSFIIHNFCALAMVGRRLHLPGRCPAHWLCQRRP